METFFMNTENSKTNEPRMLKYNLIGKSNLKNPNKNMVLANLSIYYTWKNVKSIYIYIYMLNLKYPHLHGMKHLTYQMDRIIYQLYKIILNM